MPECMSFDWKDRRTLVTGAGSGIGAATARAFAERGAVVYCVDRDAGAAAAIAAEVGGRAHTVDVTDRPAMQALADAVHADGPLDVLVNNAGIAVAGLFRDMTLEAWDLQLGVNLMGVITGCLLFAPAMDDAPGRRHIVNIASAAGFGGLPMMSAYSVSKTGVVALSEAMSAEFDPSSLGISAICPGFLPTNIARNGTYVGRMEGGRGEAMVQKLLERPGRRPEDVASAVVKAVEKNRPLVRLYSEAWTLDLARRLLTPKAFIRMKRRAK